jgi:hypothetical protein
MKSETQYVVYVNGEKYCQSNCEMTAVNFAENIRHATKKNVEVKKRKEAVCVNLVKC